MMPVSDVSFAINLLATLMVGWGFMWLNGSVLGRYKFDTYRFRFFELRDRLTVLVMEGRIEEGSCEHRVLLGLLNGAVQSTGTFEVTRFLHFVVSWANDQKTQKEWKRVIGNMRTHADPHYREIVKSALELITEMVKKDTRLLLRTFILLDSALQSPRVFRQSVDKIRRLFKAQDFLLDLKTQAAAV